MCFMDILFSSTYSTELFDIRIESNFSRPIQYIVFIIFTDKIRRTLRFCEFDVSIVCSSQLTITSRTGVLVSSPQSEYVYIYVRLRRFRIILEC